VNTPLLATDDTSNENDSLKGPPAVLVESDIAADGAEAQDGDGIDEVDVDESNGTTAATAKRRANWSRVLAFGVLPALALTFAIAAGWAKWQDSSARNADRASIESVQAAKDGAVALLSYRPDTVEQQLSSARDLLTGIFRDSYTSLTNDVVIPGAKQQQISAVATVPAAASVSADPNHAVALVFVNQTVIVGKDAATDTASSVRVTLDKVGNRWLIAGFDPV
jgi:Mce-associated membrane protein